jgi:hypothetical protein
MHGGGWGVVVGGLAGGFGDFAIASGDHHEVGRGP